jgi:hypothetical protein
MQVSERASNRQAQICAQKYYSMKIKITGKLLPVKEIKRLDFSKSLRPYKISSQVTF